MKTKPRHALLDGWDQSKLNKTTVIIGGIGATGSHTAETLARLGIGTIIAVDNDTLEEHNIFNQVYRRSQIGISKVDALKKIIGEISNTELIGVKAMIQHVDLDRFNPDILLGCFDNNGARYFLNYIAISKNKPYIDIGIERLTGSLRFILPGKTACFECWDSLMKEQEIRVGCSYEERIPTATFVGSMASNLLVNELVSFIFGKQIHPMIFFDLEKAITSPIRLEKNEECGLCRKMK